MVCGCPETWDRTSITAKPRIQRAFPAGFARNAATVLGFYLLVAEMGSRRAVHAASHGNRIEIKRAMRNSRYFDHGPDLLPDQPRKPGLRKLVVGGSGRLRREQ